MDRVLDDYTLALIFAHLNVLDLIAAQGVCARWRAIIRANHALHSPAYLAIDLRLIAAVDQMRDVSETKPIIYCHSRYHSCKDWRATLDPILTSITWDTPASIRAIQPEHVALLRAQMNVTDVCAMLRAYHDEPSARIKSQLVSIICHANYLEHGEFDEPTYASSIMRKCARFCATYNLCDSCTLNVWDRAIVAAYFARVRGHICATWQQDVIDSCCGPGYHFVQFLVHLYHISHASPIFANIIRQICARDFAQAQHVAPDIDNPCNGMYVPRYLAMSGYHAFARELINACATLQAREYLFCNRFVEPTYFVMRAKKAALYSGASLRESIIEFADQWTSCIIIEITADWTVVYGSFATKSQSTKCMRAMMQYVCEAFIKAQMRYICECEYRHIPMRTIDQLVDPFQFIDALLSHDKFAHHMCEWIADVARGQIILTEVCAPMVDYLREHYAV